VGQTGLALPTRPVSAPDLDRDLSVDQAAGVVDRAGPCGDLPAGRRDTSDGDIQALRMAIGCDSIGARDELKANEWKISDYEVEFVVVLEAPCQHALTKDIAGDVMTGEGFS
jgi:hypothetical protein